MPQGFCCQCASVPVCLTRDIFAAVVSFLSVLSGLLKLGNNSSDAAPEAISPPPPPPPPPPPQQQQQQQQQLHGSAIFSLFWSLGSFTNSDSPKKFTFLFWKLMIDHNGDAVHAFDSLPQGCSVYNWKFDVESCLWSQWSRDLPACNISPGSDAASIIVPTVDGLRHSSMLRLLLSARAHVLFVGGTGTGKTVVVTRTLLDGMPDNCHNHMMSLSARSTANSVQDSIDKRFEKRRKGVFGPPLGSCLAVFVDDMNMPARETFGASPCAEILRQLIGQGGWYDHQELSFR